MEEMVIHSKQMKRFVRSSVAAIPLLRASILTCIYKCNNDALQGKLKRDLHGAVCKQQTVELSCCSMLLVLGTISGGRFDGRHFF